jgi:hypothetical protein
VSARYGRDMSEPPTDETPPPAERQLVTRRRAPRYQAFGITGGVIGLLIGLAVGLLGSGDEAYSTRTLVGYFGVTSMLVGALLGLGVAVLTERRR